MWDTETCDDWVEYRHTLFLRAGCEQAYILKDKVNIGLIKDFVFHLFKEKWVNEIWIKLKLRTYDLIKIKFSTENYLKFNLPTRKRDLCVSD